MRWVLVLCVLAGCYSPAVRDCTVSCAQPTDCIGGQVCAAGWCAAPSTDCTEDGVPVDATQATGDASLCERGCPNGTCFAGVCVIDCSAADSCANEVTCPPNVPCRVTCGDRACGSKVICGLASSCEVVCSGLGSCADEILCSDEPCAVSCSGEGSCRKRIKCKESCACDVTCGGVGSCLETPECPQTDACRLGRGCSSALSGCDRCD